MARIISGTGQTSLTATPSVIVDENLSRAGVLITNTDLNNNIYVGNEDVTNTTGQIVFPQDSLTIPVTSAVYGVTDAETILISWLEVQ